MAFADWTDFTSEFMSTFCPENKATSALMRLESDRYFQGQQNVEAYIDKFRDLIDMSGYTDPIAIVLKFRRGLNAMTQDKIAKSGTDQPRDNNHQGWYVAARQFDLNRLANEAFCYASQHPTAQPALPRYVQPTPRRTPFSFSRPATSSTLPPTSMHAPMRPYPPALPLVSPKTQSQAALICYRCSKPGHTSRECKLHHDVCHMTLDEQDEFIKISWPIGMPRWLP
jgi:hypothetical protein